MGGRKIRCNCSVQKEWLRTEILESEISDYCLAACFSKLDEWMKNLHKSWWRRTGCFLLTIGRVPYPLLSVDKGLIDKKLAATSVPRFSPSDKLRCGVARVHMEKQGNDGRMDTSLERGLTSLLPKSPSAPSVQEPASVTVVEPVIPASC